MKDKIFFIFLEAATALLLSLLRRKRYGYSLIKSVATTSLFMTMAVVGALLMGILEGNAFGTISIYGSVFMVPVSIIVYCLIAKEDWRKMLDFFVPQICAGLVPAKALCYLAGCCYGIELYEKVDGSIVRFPSQIVEMCVVFVIMFVFLIFEKKNKFINLHYPLFFIIYGGTRFILNCLRGDLSAFVWFLPAGHFWSIVATVIGLMWLVLEQKDNDSANEIIE